ncbi:MAG TPA: methyltransferase [Burkholderiaceae bacterium]|nr:methyltransferase [Burkholderiaceae bacterium]
MRALASPDAVHRDDPARYLRGLISAAALSQAIGAAVELRVFDHLAEAPCDLDALAGATHCSRDGLQRLLRVLVAADLVRPCASAGRFSCTPLGAALAPGGARGARGLALWWSRYRWPAWAQLAASLRRGEPVRAAAPEASGFDRLACDAAAAATFNDAMTGVSHVVAADVAAKLDLAGVASVIDVGGGYGVLLSELLAAHPALHATLLDLPHALGGARETLQSRGLLARCTLLAGDFFQPFPVRAPVCVLMRVLHDWDDDPCRHILAACRASVQAAGRLCIIERLLPTDVACSPEHVEVALSDLNMLVMLGGRERTAAQLQALLAGSGWRWERVTPLALGFSLIEARA